MKKAAFLMSMMSVLASQFSLADGIEIIGSKNDYSVRVSALVSAVSRKPIAGDASARQKPAADLISILDQAGVKSKKISVGEVWTTQRIVASKSSSISNKYQLDILFELDRKGEATLKDEFGLTTLTLKGASADELMSLMIKANMVRQDGTTGETLTRLGGVECKAALAPSAPVTCTIVASNY